MTKSLLGLLFDIFNLRVHDDQTPPYTSGPTGHVMQTGLNDPNQINQQELEEIQYSAFQLLVRKSEEARLQEFGDFSLEKSFILGEAKQKLGQIPEDSFDLTLSYQTLLLAILLESRIGIFSIHFGALFSKNDVWKKYKVENLIMLITSAQNETLAARAGFLLAEIDYLSAKCLPVSPTRGHSSLSEATGEIITAHFMKIINDESSLQEHSECATRRAHQGLLSL